METWLLFDTHYFIFRAYYALPPLSNPQGQAVGAVFGFLRMLLKLWQEYNPKGLAFAFDDKHPTFRHAEMADYKANRQEAPEELLSQIPLIRQWIELCGLTVWQVPGFEADDLIASFVKNLAQWPELSNDRILIASVDKDLAQLVSDRVFLLNPFDQKIIDTSGVQAKWGVNPSQIPDYLALVGDSSDNIPGIPKIGPKTAQKLLKDFGNLENLLNHLSELPEPLRSKLVPFIDRIRQNQKLVRLADHAPVERLLPFDPKQIDFKACLEFLHYHNFKSLLSPWKKFFEQLGVFAQTEPLLRVQEKSEIVPVAQKWSGDCQRILERIHQGQAFFVRLPELKALILPEGFFDLETVWPEFPTNLVLDHLQGFNVRATLDKTRVVEWKLSWDGQLDAFLANEPIELLKWWQARVGLKPLSDFDSWMRLKQENTNLNIPESLKTLDYEISRVLYEMEKRGIFLNHNQLKELKQTWEKELADLALEIHQKVGYPLNPNSPKQVAHWLFQELKLPVVRKSKTLPSTDADVLERYQDAHPAIPLILEYRELQKFISTYAEPLLSASQRDGRVHPNWHQVSTVTGRLSSSNPNIQNIPIRSPRGIKLREIFTASPGLVLASFDYSQIELRILAHFSQEPKLLTAFQEGQDIHTVTASEIFNKAPENVTKSERAVAKTINFGIIYGQTPHGLARSLKISQSEAQQFIRAYFAKYPRVRDFLEFLKVEVQQKGYLLNVFGRKRVFHEWHQAASQAQKQAVLRSAINYPMQSSAADLAKMAMVVVESRYPGHLLLQIHDELLLEGHESFWQQEGPTVAHLMETVAQLCVPLQVDWAFGPTWGHIQK